MDRPISRGFLVTLVWTLALTGLVAPAAAQYDISGDAFTHLPPVSGRDAPAAEAGFALRSVTEIPLPGPLPPGGPAWDGARVAIPVAGGIARVHPVAGATPQISTEPLVLPVVNLEAWAVDERGRIRCRVEPGQAIQAEQRCRQCDTGWRNAWNLRVAGTTPAVPLLVDGRIFFGAMDNRIYAVKARNGHRVWVSNVAGRISRRLVLWREPALPDPAREPLTLILVVPDGGSRLLAISGRTGSEAASLKLAENEGTFVGVPLIAPDGTLIAARQKYEKTDASLVVYRLTPLGEKADEAMQRASASATSAAPEGAAVNEP